MLYHLNSCGPYEQSRIRAVLSDDHMWPSSSPATEMLEGTCDQQTFRLSPVEPSDPFDSFDLFRLRRELFSLQTNNWRF